MMPRQRLNGRSIHVRLDPDLVEYLEGQADERGISRSRLIQWILENWRDEQ